MRYRFNVAYAPSHCFHTTHSFICFIFALMLTLACKNTQMNVDKAPITIPQKANDNSYTWVKLLDSAAWKKNYNFQLFSIDNKVWVFHPDGTWYSDDAITWVKSPLQNSIGNLAFLDYVYFKGAVYGLGSFNGNIEQFVFKPIISKTQDFKSWMTLSANSNLPKRYFYHPFVFKNKVWIIGGEDKHTQYADIWNSEDCITWTKVKEHLPFGKRSSSQVVNLDSTLYLLDNDVWRSNDAIHWEKVTDEIVKGEQIFGYSAQVFDHKIWLLGCNRNGQFSSQVLSSKDGKVWQTQDAPWLPRGGIAATLHNDKIIMTGGKYGGTPNHPNFRYDNDVWMLQKK